MEKIVSPVDPSLIQPHVYELLRLIGEDPSREGLQKTPERVARSMQDLTSGYGLDPVAILRSAMFHEECSQMVVVRDIEFYSLCEHHILPFFGKVHVAYIPNGRITGLSKIPRAVDCLARRLQVQERLTRQICESVQQALSPLGAMVVVEAQHMCMQMRGVEKQGSITTTSHHTGVFSEMERRQELMQMLSKSFM